MKFLKAYIKSMRLYYAFITGIAGWIGVSFAHYLYPHSFFISKSIVALIILFLSWGVNQIFNDFLGLKEDRINAPHRPMVTGELSIPAALTLSFILVFISIIITLLFSPRALIPLILGVVLNVIYEKAKGIPYVGNIVFGIMLSMCTAYGYLIIAPSEKQLFTSSRVSVLFLVALMNGLMTYYTYFKDYAGDRAAGKITAVVLQGLSISRYMAIIGSFLPTISFIFIKEIGWIVAPYNTIFVFLFIMTFFCRCGQDFFIINILKDQKHTFHSLPISVLAPVVRFH